MTHAVSLYLLGSPQIELHGETVAVDTRKATALFAYLAVSGETHRRDAIAALLWPELDQSRALGALRRTLSSLKKGLGDVCLEISRETIAVAPGDCVWLDVCEFQRLVALARDHAHSPDEVCSSCISNLETAVSIYRGDFMAGFTLRDSPNFDDWQFFQSDALRGELAAALSQLTTLLSARGDYDSAIFHARRWLTQDPLREDAHQMLMKIYAWSGRRGAALKQYRECVRVLDQELGVSPLDQTTELYNAILEHKTSPPVKATELPEPTTSEPSQQRVAPAIPMVGRTWELDTLLGAYQKTRHKGHLFVIEGEAGIGKSRLAEEFIAAIKRAGARTIITRCYEGETLLAYAPFVDGLRDIFNNPVIKEQLVNLSEPWLVEISRLLPELREIVPDLPPAQPLESPGAKSRFFEGVRQTILRACSGSSPGVLFIDDVHWSDESSLDLLAYLSRRLHGTGLFILISWRSSELPTGTQIRTLLNEAKRDGICTTLELGRLTSADLYAILQSFLPDDIVIPDDFIQELFRETEGLPFMIVEYLTSLDLQEGAFPTSDLVIPDQVRDLVRNRLSLLDETGWQLITTAATIGRKFNFSTLRMASGRSELETIAGLEALIQHGIFFETETSDEQPGLVYDFTHNKIRQVAYEETSLVRRRLLHKRVAGALENLARSSPERDTAAGLIARHYHQAGSEQKAAEYYFLAGDHAQRLYANAEALTYYQNALALNHPHTSALQEEIAHLLTLQGDYPRALDNYESAIAFSDGERIPVLEHKIGELYSRMGNRELAICYFQSAEEGFIGRDEPDTLARLYADWSRAAFYSGDSTQAEQLVNQSLTLAKEIGDQRSQAQALNALGILARSREELEIARQHIEDCLSLLKSTPYPELEVASLNNLALVEAKRFNFDTAVDRLESALELCRQLGDRHHEAAILNNLADVLHAAGDEEASMTNLKQAVLIFSEIGGGEYHHQPDIWKLTVW